MKKNAIEIKNYSFSYENTQDWVLDQVNLTLEYGEILLLSGMSGEGKSTLISSINGIIPWIVGGEQKGEIEVDGEHIKDKKTNELSKKIGSVLQNADSQIIYSKVEDEIAFGCENINMDSKEIEREIETACKLMNLNKDWYTRTLSGGQKQRLITGAILAMNQKILIFDEPLANLDIEGAHELLSLLKELSKKGYAILIIEHRLDVVLPYADRVAWMEKGKVHVYKDKKDALEHTGTISYINGEYEKNIRVSDSPCFQAENINYSIDNTSILKDVNFMINKGERVVILGENGCGKTTLLRLIARLIFPTKGIIKEYVESDRRKKPKASWFKKVGLVYQNPNYQPFMPTVLEEIRYQAKDTKIADQLLKVFSLDAFKDRHPQSLSEGQKRKLTIASVMAMNPEVLLLDEPTVGQDYEGLKSVIKKLNEIHEKTGNTMITITHDFRCAEALADKIIWMKKGQVYKIGDRSLTREYFESQIS